MVNNHHKTSIKNRSPRVNSPGSETVFFRWFSPRYRITDGSGDTENPGVRRGSKLEEPPGNGKHSSDKKRVMTWGWCFYGSCFTHIILIERFSRSRCPKFAAPAWRKAWSWAIWSEFWRFCHGCCFIDMMQHISSQPHPAQPKSSSVGYVCWCCTDVEFRVIRSFIINRPIGMYSICSWIRGYN